MDVRWNSLKVVFLALVSFSLVSSCTHSGGASSQVSLTFPQSKQMSQSENAEVAVHIAVNVSASDMTTVYWSWDNSDSSPTLKTNAVLSVPQGSARLIQVMYVTQDEENNLYFYYGDITQDLLVTNPSVSVAVSALTSSSTQGKIVGRYVNATGGGPTGILSSYFTPGVGKPAMIVDQNEIFGGWFKAFSLPTNPFTYKSDDGTVVLANYAAAPAFVTGQSTALVNIPAAYRIYSGQNSPNFNSAETILAGFFGPGSTGKRMCVNTSNGVSIPYLFSDNAGSTPITWNGSLSSCTSHQACLVQGGVSASVSPCMSPDNINYLKLHELLLAGDDSSMMFKGPFLMADLGSGTSAELNGTLTGSNLALSWQFMPGAAAGLDGVEFFYKWDSSSNTNGNPPYKLNNGYACSSLVSTYGFTSGGKFSTSQSTASFNVGAGTSGQSLVALGCPYSNSRNPIYFTTAAQYTYTNSSGSLNQLVLTDAGGHATTATVNVCKPYTISALSGGAAFANPGGMSIVLTTTAQSGNLGTSGFATNSSCSGATANLNFSISAGQSTATVYFLGSLSNYFMISSSTNLSGFQSVGMTIGAVTAAPPTPNNIYFVMNAPVISGYNRLASGQCYPLTAELQGAGSVPTIGGGSATVAPTGTLTGFFYAGSTCQGTALNATDTSNATITIPTGDQSAVYSFKPDVTTQTSGSPQIQATGISPASASGIFNIKAAPATQAAAPNAYSLTPMSSNGQAVFDPGACLPISISAANSVLAQVQVASSQTLALAATGGSLFTTNSCTGAAATSITLTPQNSFAQVYLQVLSNSTAATFSVTDSSTVTQTLSLSVAPPASVIWAGQTAIATGTCVPVVLNAVTSSNQPYHYPVTSNPILSSSGSYYTDSLCTSATSNATFLAGSSTSNANLYVMFLSTATPSGFVDGSSPINFNGMIPSQTFMTPQVVGGACSGTGATVEFAISAVGVPFNPSQIPNLSTTVTLPVSPTVNGCTNSSYSSCSATTVTITIAHGTTNSSAPVYIKLPSPAGLTVDFGNESLPGIVWSNPNMNCP